MAKFTIPTLASVQTDAIKAANAAIVQKQFAKQIAAFTTGSTAISIPFYACQLPSPFTVTNNGVTVVFTLLG